MFERGLRGAALERDVAVDERVRELPSCELFEVGLLVFQHAATLPMGCVSDPHVVWVCDAPWGQP